MWNWLEHILCALDIHEWTLVPCGQDGKEWCRFCLNCHQKCFEDEESE